jgi:hypothetical protein
MPDCSAGDCGISCPGICSCAVVATGSCACRCDPEMLTENMGTFDFTPVVFTRGSSSKADAAFGLDDEIEIDTKDFVLASLAEFLIPKDKQHAVAIPVGLVGKRVTSREKGTTLRKYFQSLGALFVD